MMVLVMLNTSVVRKSWGLRMNVNSSRHFLLYLRSVNHPLALLDRCFAVLGMTCFWPCRRGTVLTRVNHVRVCEWCADCGTSQGRGDLNQGQMLRGRRKS